MDLEEHQFQSTLALAAVGAAIAGALSQSDASFAANLESSMERIYYKLRDSGVDSLEAQTVLRHMRELLK